MSISIRILRIVLLLLVQFPLSALVIEAAPQMEALGRGVVAIRTSTTQAYVGWRMLGGDPESVAFNLYRSLGGAAAVKLNGTPLTTTTNYYDTPGSSGFATTVSYHVRPVIGGVEQAASGSFTLPANAAVQPMLSIPLQRPAGGTTPDGFAYTYRATEGSPADLDGDGEYELIVKWDPNNAKDNAQSGYTGSVLIDAYKMNGTRLWRIDLGRNIRAGAHYTQFMVYDLDGDGRAELACKTAPGTYDGLGNAVLLGSDSVSADYRNGSGYILSGPEYLTVFDGLTGGQLATTGYVPGRGTVSNWGDNYGNRVDRFVAGVAYLDGNQPSLVMCRGYYTQTHLVAWDWRNGALTQRWHFNAPNGNSYAGQGNHQLSVADVDDDGKQEIIYGAMVVDDNGTGLHTTGLGHADALHVSDFRPSRPGQEVFTPHENAAYNGNIGTSFRDGKTGELIWTTYGNGDIGRGCMMDLDPRYPGGEAWATNNGNLYSAYGPVITGTPANMFVNFGIWWDADPQRELLNETTISKWNYNSSGRSNILEAWRNGAVSSNGTKATPFLSGDILGDWREEAVFANGDSTALLVFVSTIAATDRRVTFLNDPQYRVALAWQNVAYNQPPHPSFNVASPPAFWAGGSPGSWSSASANWSRLTPSATPAVMRPADTAVFRAPSALEVSLSGALTPSHLIVESPADVTLSGPGTLAGSGTWNHIGPGLLRWGATGSFSTWANVFAGPCVFATSGLLTVPRLQVHASGAVGGSGRVAGTLELKNGSKLLVDAAGPFRVTGNLIASGPLSVAPAPGQTLAPGTYTVLTYTGTLAGSPVFVWSAAGQSATFDTSTAGTVRMTVANHSTTPALQARYPFDGSGTNSQGGPPATIAGNASYGPGILGEALNLDGSANSVNIGPLSGALYQNFTASAWVWRDGGNDYQRIFDFGSGTDEYMTLMLFGTTLRFEFRENGVTQGVNAPIPALGQWAHIAVTLNGSTATIYVNGTAVASSNAISNDPANVLLAYNYLGKSQFGADPLFNGKIDDFRLYNHALSGSQISGLVAEAPPFPAYNLVAGATGTKVQLNWGAPFNTQSYTIKRGTTPGGPHPTTLATGVTATTYADTTVVSGNTYYYVVIASNTQGNSVDSNEASAVVSDLIARLRFDETTGTTASDSSGNTWNATLANTPTWTPGILKNAVTLPNTGAQHLTLPAGIASGLNDFTISTWVRMSAIATYARIFDFGTSTAPSATTGSYMFLTPSNGSAVRFAITTSGYSNEQVIAGTAPLATGTWVHIAVTLSGSTGRIYLNGTQVGINPSMTLKPSSLGNTTLNYLGRSQFAPDPYLNGSLDDFRIYSRALTGSELTALANPTAGAPENLTAIPDEGKTNLSWTVPDAATSYTVKRSLTSGGPHTPVAGGTGLTGTSFIDTGLTNGTTYYYVVTASNSLGTGATSAEVAVTPSYLRVHYQFDETTGTVAADSSGRGIDATTFNGPAWAAGRLDNALVLAQASSQYASLPTGVVSGLTDATIMTWVKTSSVATWQRIFDFGTGTDNYMFLTTQYATGGNANKLRFTIRTPGVPESAANQINSSVATPAGTWAHVAVVFNGSTGTLYLNGVQVGQSTTMTLNPSSLGSTTQNYLGKSQFSDPYLNASLDDFRIYSRAMDAGEVALFAAPLASPQNVAATSEALSIGLSWDPVPNAATYTVKYATVAGGPYATLATGLVSPDHTHTGLTYGAARYYVISASNPAGTGPDSAEVAASAGSPLISAVETSAPSIALGSNGTASFSTASSVIGHTYQLQTCTDLVAGDWIDVAGPMAGTGAALQFETPYDPLDLRRFYRLFISR